MAFWLRRSKTRQLDRIPTLAEGHTFYTLNRGIPELREAIATYMSALHGHTISADRITVTASAMNAISVLTQTLVDRGDNVADAHQRGRGRSDRVDRLVVVEEHSIFISKFPGNGIQHRAAA